MSASYPDVSISIKIFLQWKAGPLRFVTSHSLFAPASMWNQAKNEAPEEETGLM